MKTYTQAEVDQIKRDMEMANIRILNSALVFILNAKNIRAAVWSVAYALGSALCHDTSMRYMAKTLGVTPSSISKGAVYLVQSNGLRPSHYMQSKHTKRAIKKTKQRNGKL